MNRILRILRRVGPGIITASVVLGPGSIVAASKAGAVGGYRLLWLLVVSALFMAAYTSMAARLGCVLEVSPLTYVSARAGRWLALLAGLSAFFVTAGFQSGNNIGIAVALDAATGVPKAFWPIAFTLISLFFLFFARRVYAVIERLMALLVAVMIVCFFANLLRAGPSLRGVASGLSPKMADGDGLIARGMLATTFSIIAAFYQAYLVQAKRWGREDLADAVHDAWAGIVILGLISAAILVGAAETLHGAAGGFATVEQLARQLAGLLGPWARLVFSCGLAAAALSSFLVNAIIGGGMLADGLGLDPSMDSRATRILAAFVMLAGCAVACSTFIYGTGTTTAVLVAQASTLLAAPLCAVMLLALTSSEKTMGDLKNKPASVFLGLGGLAVILWLGALWLKGRLG